MGEILLRRGNTCVPPESCPAISVRGSNPPLAPPAAHRRVGGGPRSPSPHRLGHYPPTPRPTPAHPTHTRRGGSIVPSHRRVQGEESEIIIDTGRHYPVRFYLALLPTTQLVRDLVRIHVGPLLPVDLERGKEQQSVLAVLVRSRTEKRRYGHGHNGRARTCATRGPKTGGGTVSGSRAEVGGNMLPQILRRNPNSHALSSLRVPSGSYGQYDNPVYKISRAATHLVHCVSSEKDCSPLQRVVRVVFGRAAFFQAVIIACRPAVVRAHRIDLSSQFF